MNERRIHCQLWRSSLIELARGRLSDANERIGIIAHLSGCPECSLLLEEQTALTGVTAELAAETSMAPAANLESILLSEFDSTRSLHRRYLKLAAVIALAAAALAWFAANQRGHVTPPGPGLQPRIVAAAAAAIPPAIGAAGVLTTTARNPVRKPARHPQSPKPASEAAPFVAIPYTVPLDLRERTTVMRMEMPVAALMAVGLTAGVPDPGARAVADVVVGEDGRIHAIRLVSLTSSIQGSSAFNSHRSIDQ